MAMAYAAVTSLLTSLEWFCRPNQLIKLYRSDQLEYLIERLRFLQTFLQRCAEKCSNSSQRRIRSAAEHAQDVLEELVLDNLSAFRDLKLCNPRGLSIQGSSRFQVMQELPFRECIFLDEISRRKPCRFHDFFESDYRPLHGFLQYGMIDIFKKKYGIVGCLIRLLQEIDSIDRVSITLCETRVDGFKVARVGNYPETGDSSVRHPTSTCDDTTIGLEEDLTTIRDRLTMSPSRLEIVSIVRMGGIGKTTLVRKVYEDPSVVYHFHIRAWITVTQEYRVRNILQELLCLTAQINNEELSYEDDQQFDELLLYRSLKGSTI